MFGIDKLSMLSGVDLNAKFLLGVILFAGLISARFSRKIHAPQVVGYIVVGIILGQSGFNIINKDILETFVPFNYFALGVIGFMIGGELKKEVFRRYGKQFILILLGEGLTTFFTVFLLVGILGSLVMGNSFSSWALGLLLGAIASATAPATTTDVLRENKSRGPLTTTVMGVMAMDNSLALVFFALASSIASVILGTHPSASYVVASAFYGIGMGVISGVIFSLILIKILKKYADKDKILAFSLCGILVALGSALIMGIEMLVVAISMGIVFVNKEPRLSREVFKLISGFAMPFYVLFFVLVGAKFDYNGITLTLGLLTLLYVAGRTFGKIAGTSFGAKRSGLPETVRKYLPFCFFSQAGMAVGLSILAFQNFPGVIGDSVVVIITISVLIAEISGPPLVRYAVLKSGEGGLDISEEDILNETKVGMVMDKNPPCIYEKTSLKAILDIFSQSSYYTCPVINRGRKLRGIITIEGIKKALAYSEVSDLIIAYDIMEPVITRQISPDSSLLEAEEILAKYHIDYLPVVDESSVLLGFLEKASIEKFVSTRLIKVKSQLDSMAIA